MSNLTADTIHHLEEVCSVFYQAESIPVYLIQNKKPIAIWPQDQPDYLIPLLFIQPLEQETESIGYLTTPFSTYIGFFRLEENLSIYIGPVGTIPLSDEVIQQICRYYCIARDESSNLFYRSIPPHTITEFLSILNLLYFMCTGTHVVPSSIRAIHTQTTNSDNHISDFVHLYMENQLNLLDSAYYNNSYDIERLFEQCIENGDIDAGEHLLSNIYHISAGRTAKNIAMHNKNLFVITITVYTRAAIRGGLDTQTAFSLSDAYLQQVDRTPTSDVIDRLLIEAFREFTRRVNQLSYPADLNQDLLRCIQFVKRNVNRRITVSDVADFIGYSRQYLSQRFKKELGFDLGKFILRTKLTEAQQLLSFSSKTLSEISELLCFSSQSHFQRAFKAQFGITPLEYRRQNKKRD